MLDKLCRRVLAGCAVLAVVPAAGCSAKSTPPGPPAIGALPVVAGPADIVLPLDDYLETDTQYATSVHALLSLTAQCMSRYGFTASTDFGRLPTWRDHGNLFGLVDDADTRRAGYKWFQPREITVGDTAKDAAPPRSPEERAVAVGSVPAYAGKTVPKGGCDQEAAEKLATGEPGAGVNDAFVQNLENDAYQQTEADPRVLAAFKDWSACMAASGYQYSVPKDANNAAFAMPEADQMTMAAVDLKCRQKANLVPLQLAVDRAYQQRLIEKNAQALNDMRKAISVQADNAARELATSHGTTT
ncbi:hypothetical protein [Catenulispora subtropica]